ncbi:amidase signature domain-containing protein [Mycena leptocephala]|nr:amidase signature domain-containing protein [Mycena leptocephala]
MVQTNFFGFVRLVKNVVPLMAKRKKGTVVAIGSILGELATPFQGFYNASKAALHSYTETLRMECQPLNVKVVLVAPGSIKSNISVKSAYTVPEDSFYKAFEKQIKHVMYQSQTKDFGVMDTDEFATTVVRKITAPKPPQYLTLGGFATQWKILKWLPRVWTASQVLEAFIAQSLVAHSATNCITEVLFDHARERAKELDIGFKKTNRLKGPLHGVPISVKDQYNVEGFDTTIGFTACINKPAQFTADFVQTMIDAGAVPFVKTNVPQTMYAYECSNPLWGRTCNPYNAAYSSGGSSGGEACLGSDIGGSLRIPAAYCGVYSFKPGIGRVSDYGAKESFPGFDGIKSVCGPMARCIDDLELACRISFGAPGAYNDQSPVPFRDVNLPKKLRFGYYTSDGIMKASPACIRAMEQTIDALKLAGHECIELDQHLTPEILKLYLVLTSADGYKTLLREKGSDPLDPSLSVLTLGPKVPQFLRDVVAWAIDKFVGDKVMSDVLHLSGSCSVEEYHTACFNRNKIKKTFYQEFWHKHNLDGIITHIHASPQTMHG